MSERSSDSTSTEESFHILFVCTGNICRSPMAECLSRHSLQLHDASGQILASSAGTDAQDGMPMHDLAAVQLSEHGIDPSEFRSRSLTRQQVDSADLILTAERWHRDAVIKMSPGASRRTFTLKQLAFLLENAKDDIVTGHDRGAIRGRKVVSWAVGQRGVRRIAEPREFDLPDPLGHPERVFAATASEIASGLEHVLRFLVDDGPHPREHLDLSVGSY